jgi:hypothetical protein
MTASHPSGRFAIPFRVPILFSPRMVWVTAAETSSREEKRCPWDLLTWPISRIPIDSRLDWLVGEVNIFAFSHDNTLLSHFVPRGTLSFMMILRWSQANIIICLTFDCARRKFFGSRRGWTSPLVRLWFYLRFKVSNPCFVKSEFSIQECWTFDLNCFSNVRLSRRFYFCSAVKHWGTQQAQNFLFCKSYVKIRNTNWWNSRSLWYFLARRSTNVCKKVRHNFHTSFICWCLCTSWLWIIQTLSCADCL